MTAEEHNRLTSGKEAGDCVWRSRSHENRSDHERTGACHQHGTVTYRQTERQTYSIDFIVYLFVMQSCNSSEMYKIDCYSAN